ncbi:RecB family exonuclease [Aquipuribacter sp. SD81]|uniref:RecB family exonuclease n=1 Tax=Aquipuribacter sp. SD81 TaxID=3127703 RepID=UPI0030193662
MTVSEHDSPPAGAAPSPGAPADRLGALSPSRAGDFKQCPLLFRFRTVDRLPQQPSGPALRGTVVHRALELLFEVPAPRRTPDHARSLLAPALDELAAEDPAVAALVGEGDARTAWLAEAGRLVDRWFELEDPRRLEPAARELYVEHRVADDLVLRGVVDRVDVAPDGRVRVVDYKTGRAPGEAFEQRALFQMKFYALLLWRTRGRVPTRVQLVYVGGQGETLPLDVDEHMLEAFERTLLVLWRAIRTAAETGDWQARPGRVCSWCDHRDLCPAWGGTPPPLPADAADRVLRLVPVERDPDAGTGGPQGAPWGAPGADPGANPMDPHPG